MKTRLNHSTGRRRLGSGPPAAALALLLAALPATAQTDTPYTATGWLTGVPVPGVLFTNALGEVGLRGNAHTLRVQSTDARLTGQRLAFADGAYQADGTALVWGTAYQEVGTFDAANNFTATGGLWEMTYRGTMPADNSLQLHIVGRGSGGSIEGWRFEEDLTKAAGAPWDPADPYPYIGTIKPPPLNTSEVVDNFDDNLYTGNTYGKGTVTESNQQLIAGGSFAGVYTTTSILDSYVMGGPPNTTLNVPDGMTKEWRADLVSLDDNATNGTVFFIGTESGGYNFVKGLDFVFLNKFWPGSSISMFACEKVTLKNTDVVLALALTRVEPDVVITARVLDKADPNTVLYQHSVVDTPGVDSTLTTAEFEALTGMRFLDLIPDGPGAPYTTAAVALGVFQYTDGTQPAPTAIFDNLELRTSEIPPVGIERAVRLSWPASATINYAVEGATLQGPWLPIQDLPLPGMRQTTVPASEAAQIFRLRQAP